jgi:hypothetical protein
MRPNKFGVRGLKSVWLKGRFVYFWVPPVSLQRAGIFRHTTLSTDFDAAVAKARALNERLDSHRDEKTPARPTLGPIIPMTVADLFRKYESSPRFGCYVPRTRQDYSCFYRLIERTVTNDGVMFGNLNFLSITKQTSYHIYEQYVRAHGHDSANKAMSACQSAFGYAMLRFEGISLNPFVKFNKFSPPPRRQRWTDEQLSAFISKQKRWDTRLSVCVHCCVWS